jgi:CubicO group peptidase (beta-lactamase class C family)
MTMLGFPPPPAERWTLDDWQTAPFNRWSFSHLREVVPTAKVRRSLLLQVLAYGEPIDLGVIVSRPDGTTTTAAEVLAESYTDGFIVVSDGLVVAEQYHGALTPGANHLLMSVSKSIVGCVLAILAERGLVDLTSPVTRYIPELIGGGYEGATLRDLLDMRSGVAYSELYLDPDSEVRLTEQVIGWAPRTRDDLPRSLYEYLATLGAERPHGGPFKYRSCESDVLGWVCERASGRRMAELLSDLLWVPLGTEEDLDAAVDPAGAVLHDGGLAASLRDLARFGLAIADGGLAEGRQVIPSWWLTDACNGGPDSAEAFAADPTNSWMPGGLYRNQFWVPYPGRPVLVCLGINGQLIYTDAATRFVAVKLSSWPYPQQKGTLLDTMASIEALNSSLASRPGLGPNP